MDVIVAFIRWKRFWKAQAPVARASQVHVNHRAIMDGIMGLRGLGKRDAEEPSHNTYADPSEGCIIKMHFWRSTTDIAESTVHSGYSLLLYYKRFN